MKFTDLNLSEEKLEEAYITDPHDIRAHVIKSLLEWYEDNMSSHYSYTLFDVLPAYMVAIGAKFNESTAMIALAKTAGQIMLKEYRDLVDENDLLYGYDQQIIKSLDVLGKLGFNDKFINTIKEHIQKLHQEDMEKYKKDNPDEFNEAEVWDKPNPKKKHKTLTPSQKAAAKARAKKAGRKYPNMVDNIWAARKRK